MPRARSSSMLVGLATAFMACQSPSGLADGVDFTVTPLAFQADPRVIAYRFVVTNRSADTIWMAACNHRITPDIAFTVNGRIIDTANGAVCLAIYDMSPVALAEGESYAGDRAVPIRAGVRYVPYLGVGRDRSLQSSARLQADAFNAP